MSDGPTTEESLALASGVAAAVGTYPPWVVTRPGVEIVPQVYLEGMGWRVAGFDFLLVALVVVGLVAAGATRHRRLGGRIAATTGLAVSVGSVMYALVSIGGYLGVFLPGPGVVVTVAGGLGLMVAGWRHLGASDPSGPATMRGLD